MTIRARNDGEPLRIVCTDRGRHRRTQLANYWHGPMGDRVTSHAFKTSAWGPGDLGPDETPLSSFSMNSYQFYCSRCGRNPKLRPPLVAFARVYSSGELDCLDISLLDL